MIGGGWEVDRRRMLWTGQEGRRRDYVGSAPDGRQSNGGTLNMCARAGTGRSFAWNTTRDVFSTFLSYGSSGRARGDPYSTHTHRFFRIVVHYSKWKSPLLKL